MAKYCGATIWREFTRQDYWDGDEKYNVSKVTCTKKPGHEGKHGGWLGFMNDLESGIEALVAW